MAANGGIALVTGAAGGIGSACAARLTADWLLFLTDLDSEGLRSVTEQLSSSGARIVGSLPGDLREIADTSTIVAAARAAGPLGAVVHAAGLTPGQGSAADILRANVVAVEHLLSNLESGLETGLATVLIASMAGHVAPTDSAIDSLMRSPLDAGVIAEAVKRLTAMATDEEDLRGSAYSQSKRASLAFATRRCADWGKRNARITTVSPGLVSTDAGNVELGRQPRVAAMLEMTPLGRIAAADVAEAVAFLISPAACKITGCDLLVDAGITGAILGGAANPDGSEL